MIRPVAHLQSVLIICNFYNTVKITRFITARKIGNQEKKIPENLKEEIK